MFFLNLIDRLVTCSFGTDNVGGVLFFFYVYWPLNYSKYIIYKKHFVGLMVPPIAISPIDQASVSSCRFLLNSCEESPSTGISVSSKNTRAKSRIFMAEMGASRVIYWPLC